MSNTDFSCRKFKNAIEIVFFTWFYCTIPSFLMMAFLFFTEKRIDANNFLGIEANEILVYIISFIGCIVAYYFTPLDSLDKFRTKSSKIICSISIIILIICVAVFVFLKMNLPPEKNKLLFNFICIFYLISIIVWIWHTCISSPPSSDSIDLKNEQELKNLESKFTSKLGNRR